MKCQGGGGSSLQCEQDGQCRPYTRWLHRSNWKEVRGQYVNIWGESFGQKEQPVQRPCGGSVPGMFCQQQGGQYV